MVNQLTIRFWIINFNYSMDKGLLGQQKIMSG